MIYDHTLASGIKLRKGSIRINNNIYKQQIANLGKLLKPLLFRAFSEHINRNTPYKVGI